ncbi:MAG: winged helix-turn-helix domain-containing protein [Actinomycetota bacterium]
MDVRLVRWPAARDQLHALRAEGIPRLVVVDADVVPPEPADELEDWVRLPADQADVRIRVDTLARRAESRHRPALSNEGVLRFQGEAVPLSPVEARVVDALMKRFGAVVSRRDLTESVWPEEAPPRNALDVHISRVRRRVAEVGLQIRTVRGRGYLLDAPSDSGQQLAANG